MRAGGTCNDHHHALRVEHERDVFQTLELLRAHRSDATSLQEVMGITRLFKQITLHVRLSTTCHYVINRQGRDRQWQAEFLIDEWAPA